MTRYLAKELEYPHYFESHMSGGGALARAIRQAKQPIMKYLSIRMKESNANSVQELLPTNDHSNSSTQSTEVRDRTFLEVRDGNSSV